MMEYYRIKVFARLMSCTKTLGIGSVNLGFFKNNLNNLYPVSIVLPVGWTIGLNRRIWTRHSKTSEDEYKICNVKNGS